MNSDQQKIGFGTISYYFIPLALQAAAQSFTYPLVAIVAAHSIGGTLNIAGLMQGNNVMNIMGMLGCGLITTGMVYGKTKEGYNSFRKLSRILGVVVCLLQLSLTIPLFAHFVFSSLLHLPEPIENAAYQVVLIGIPLQFLFFIRNPYVVALYNNKKTAKASIPSFARIFFTAILAKIFVMSGLVGIRWAVICMTIPVAIETILYMYFATPYIRKLEPSIKPTAKKLEMFLFNIPLSISSALIFFTTFLMAAYIARAPNREQMLPVYYLALGLVNPMSFAATKIQAIVIMFSEETKGNFILPKYAVTAGLVLGALPLLFTLPIIGNFYYVHVQNLPIDQMPLIKETALLLFFAPLAISLRSYSEGLAAFNKKTTTFITGQAIYLSAAAVVGFFSLNLGIPGNLIGGIGLICANLASATTMRLAIFWDKQREEEFSKGSAGPTEQI